MLGLFSIWCDPKSDNIMYKKEFVKGWDSSHLPCFGWYLNCLLDCILVSERSKWEKFDLRFLEKLASSQGNKEDIDKKKKKKKDVQVSSTPRAMQTPINIENPKQNVNA